MDLVVCGNVFINGSLEKCCVGIENGKISAIKKVLKSDRVLDFGDKLILPAGIDMHVHFRDPGMTHKEDFESGSLSAAFGGISCVIDMPNTKPPTVDTETFLEKKKLAESKSFIDFGLYAGITERSDLAKLAHIATGFKLYMGETTGMLVFNNLEILGTKLGSLPGGMEKVVAIHAENAKILQDSKKSISDDKYKNLRGHMQRRPAEAEITAIREIIEFKKRFNNIPANIKFHISHVSSAGSIEVLKNIEEISCEVTPHHLLLSIENSEKLRTFAKVNPPLRTENDRQALWQAFRAGRLNTIGSDHAPHTIEEKEVPFSEAPSGLPGVETAVPLMLSTVKHGQLPLDRFVSGFSEKPAGLFGIKKGKIEKGYDADLIVVDMRAEHTLKTNMLHSKCEWTPYKNMQVIFPRMTLCRGKIVIFDDGIESEPGSGQYIS